MANSSKRPSLDEEQLRALALGYVGRYATSRAKLLSYLARKLKERGWSGEGPADTQAIVDRISALGYIDDAAFATMKAAALTRRGYGLRRVSTALHAAGIAEEDRAQARETARADRWAAAQRFAQRKRAGPYAAERPDPKARERLVAAFLRAGHDHATAIRWVDARPGEPPEADEG